MPQLHSATGRHFVGRKGFGPGGGGGWSLRWEVVEVRSRREEERYPAIDEFEPAILITSEVTKRKMGDWGPHRRCISDASPVILIRFSPEMHWTHPTHSTQSCVTSASGKQTQYSFQHGSSTLTSSCIYGGTTPCFSTKCTGTASQCTNITSPDFLT